MKWERIEGNWREFEGRVKERWGKLTSADLTLIKGKRERLVGRLQHAYGYDKGTAETEILEFLQSITSHDTASKRIS